MNKTPQSIEFVLTPEIISNLIAGYFQDYVKKPKDEEYYQLLINEFSDELDIAEELKQFQAWVLDQPLSKKIYYRSRFRSWLKTAREYRKPTQFSRYPTPSFRRPMVRQRE